MKKFGLTDERYAQMMAYWRNHEAVVAEIVHEWGADRCNKGYEIFDFDGTGMLEIEAINDVGCFDSEEEAARQAMRDGIKLIPIEELPENFDRRYLGWIDTEENRKRIEAYCLAREDENDGFPYTPSSTYGDYSPGNPWDAPGMSAHNFIR